MSANELLDQLQMPDGWQDIHFAVALSGGADSTALLCAVTQLKQIVGGAGRVIALHVNHSLRGQQSDADARWCQQQCNRLGISLEILVAETARHAAETSQGIEAAAREQRYQLLTAAAERAGARYLATAHTQDDQVETVLFRLLRGTGLRGLSGIPPQRVLTSSLSLVRPLLHCTRAMVLDYLAQRQQDYRTDRSNADQQFTRNRVRHTLLPLLRDQFNAEVNQAIVRLAAQADSAQALVEDLARELLEQSNVSVEPSELSLSCAAWTDQQQLVVSEALRLLWRRANLPEQAMNYDWWCQFAAIAQSSVDASVLNLPGEVRASIDGDRLLIEW